MTDPWRRVIALLEIIGGVAGVGLLVWELSNVRVSPALLALASVLLLLYLLSFAAGVLLWRGHRWGRWASVVVQAFQLPKIVSPAILFNIVFGADLYAYFLGGPQGFFRVGFELKLLAFHQLHIGVPIEGFGLGVSVPACIFLVKLLAKGGKAPQEPGGGGVPMPTDPGYMPPPPPQYPTESRSNTPSGGAN